MKSSIALLLAAAILAPGVTFAATAPKKPANVVNRDFWFWEGRFEAPNDAPPGPPPSKKPHPRHVSKHR